MAEPASGLVEVLSRRNVIVGQSYFVITRIYLDLSKGSNVACGLLLSATGSGGHETGTGTRLPDATTLLKFKFRHLPRSMNELVGIILDKSRKLLSVGSVKLSGSQIVDTMLIGRRRWSK